MKYRTFGKLGWQVSEIGFGGWALGGLGWGGQRDEDSVAALKQALDLGCNFIDTAQGYGDGHSERVIGKFLKAYQGGRVYVATKIPVKGPGDWPPSPYDDIVARYPEKYLRECVEVSLRNLQTDCLDLLQLHTWTRAWNRNPAALEVLRELRREGKLRGIGISTPEQDQNSVVDLMRDGWLDSVQVIYNIFEQEPQAELLPAALEHNVGVIVRVAFDEGVAYGQIHRTNEVRPGRIPQQLFCRRPAGAHCPAGRKDQGDGRCGGTGCGDGGVEIRAQTEGRFHRHSRNAQCAAGPIELFRQRPAAVVG